jgi:hypothetical protein
MAKKARRRRIVATLELTPEEANLVAHALENLATEMKQCFLDDTYSSKEQGDWRKAHGACLVLLGRLLGGE